ncbi:MAG: hypothetical protein LUF87_00180 [Alistipes sp.]|nr:hypothetical protein [Alistipes sp.]
MGTYLIRRYRSKPYTEDSLIKKRLEHSLLLNLDMFHALSGGTGVKLSSEQMRPLSTVFFPDNELFTAIHILVQMYRCDLNKFRTERFLGLFLSIVEEIYEQMLPLNRIYLISFLYELYSDNYFRHTGILARLCDKHSREEIAQFENLVATAGEGHCFFSTPEFIYLVTEDKYFIPIYTR